MERDYWAGEEHWKPERKPPSEQDLRETVEDLVRQFGVHTTKDGVPALWTGGLSALEGAFALLGWDDPHLVPDEACEVEGCGEWATCGTLTPDVYKRLCGTHFRLCGTHFDELHQP